MFRSGFLCRTLPLLSQNFAELADRLDSFEREFIELKAFRQAVEATSPKVAEAATEFLKDHKQEVKALRVTSDNPLTSDEFTELNQFYAKQKGKVVPCENLLFINSPNDLIQHSEKIFHQYLVRVSKLARHLNNAPYGLSQMPGIQELKKHYQWSFHDVRNTAVPVDKDSLYPFDRVVRRVFLRHYNVSDLLTKGMTEFAIREQWKSVNDEAMRTHEDLQPFFEEFCLKRVRLRFLVGNYMYLSTKILDIPKAKYGIDDPDDRCVPVFFDHDPADFVGKICKKCSLLTLAKCAVKEFQAKYDAEIELKLAGDADLYFVGNPYITHDIISAMLDDAIIANTDREELLGKPCTKLEVTLAQTPTNKRFVLRVSDTAGGMTLSQSRTQLSCWSLYKNIQHHEDALIRTWTTSPLRLPYAYCAARVIGGNLTVASIEGYGTDRQLYLPSTGLMGVSL
ncbi:putative mitochondrial pyruvate dehydrogenase (lipoamide) kinase [Leptomonas pyrrhocoris]|uniref:Protein-serine/threonine kinase n=1 Tax=Leptomonas pyrrhocoris TaxID=157538 RepID=A0A0N0DUI4_LEPPY|nr:putative mitochondrial pyruvate dehydrogenase (lipoamide) kinase [Leptomonas pyrrhocoris]KPA78988.1 putative mitochondrial pyruvate dehydrogenase (lipoamide) kinase [Leptomonas pyrrhocoris]|eukprot:XP_015657427.1 putative mitochondrial pyruvate dehydrogenase (lipoamide) kinase [Leptomonas pyrrhocoris]